MDVVLSHTILFIIIFIYISIIVIFIYCTYFNNNQSELPPRKDELYKFIISKKQDIIINIDDYSCSEINNKINEIVDLYIINKCDFIEDYNENVNGLIKTYKIQIINPSLYNNLKRNQIINYIKQQLLLIYKNELIATTMYKIHSHQELQLNEDIDNYTTTEIVKVKISFREYKSYINQLFISIDEYNEVNVV